MAKQIKVYYTKLHNMGDQLNELILEKCFGCEVVRCSFLEGELCAIGSCLGMYTLHGTFPMRNQWDCQPSCVNLGNRLYQLLGL